MGSPLRIYCKGQVRDWQRTSYFAKANALPMAMFKPPVHDEFGINLNAGTCLGARLCVLVRAVGVRSIFKDALPTSPLLTRPYGDIVTQS